MARIGPVEWLMGAAGLGLVVAAVRNESPWGVVREALTGDASARRPLYEPTPIVVAGVTGAGVGVGGSTLIPGAGNVSDSRPGKPNDLQQLGQGGHRLRAGAVAAFGQWERLFGRSIPITDSYRDYDVQLAGHRREPKRFVHPDRSAHPRGEAVDVNLQALGSSGRRGESTYDRLVSTGKAAGWCFSAYDKAEPWHASWNGCR